MKFQIISLAIAGLALAACSGPETDTEAPLASTEVSEDETGMADETASDTETVSASAAVNMSELREDCDVLTSDPEAQESFAEMGTDAAAFCDCFVSMIEEKPEAERAQILPTLERVTDEMSETGEGAEDVVSRIMSEVMGMGASQEAEDTTTGIMLIGGVIDETGNRLEDGGTCAAG